MKNQILLFIACLLLFSFLAPGFTAFIPKASAAPQPQGRADCSSIGGYCEIYNDPTASILYVVRPITQEEYSRHFQNSGIPRERIDVGSDWVFIEATTSIGSITYISQPRYSAGDLYFDRFSFLPNTPTTDAGTFLTSSVTTPELVYWCPGIQPVTDPNGCLVSFPSVGSADAAKTFWLELRESEEYKTVDEAIKQTPWFTMCVDRFEIKDGTDTESNIDRLCADRGGILIPGFNLVHSAADCEALKARHPSLSNVQTIDCEQTKAIIESSFKEVHEKPCSGFGIGWILCTIVDMAFDIMFWMFDNLIKPFMVLNPLNAQAEADSPTGKLFDIWNTVRIIASIGFVAVFAISIFANSFGFILTPYDFKKTMPRLAIGFISIQLSWYVVAFFVDVFNVLGVGVHNLILAPLNGLSPNLRFDPNFLTTTLTAILLSKGAVATFFLAGTFKGFVGLLPMILLPIVMFIVSATLVLLLRHILILMLVITAPLAALAWTLPNTEKLAKTWFDILVKVLVMFPLIMGLIAIGELVASIVTQDSDDALLRIAGLVALFAPFILIPFTFRFAGGVIGGFVQGFDRVRGGLSQRLFGSANDQNSYRGIQRAIREKNRSQRMHRRFREFNNLKAGRLGGRRRVLGVARAPGTYAMMRWSGGVMPVDERLARRTKEAKERVEQITHTGREEYLYALFGDTHPLTGKRLPNDAINMAIRYRDDDAMLTAGMIYLMSRAGSAEEVQRYINTLGQLNKDKKMTSFVPGIWKGVAFANQKVHRDLKHRSITDRKANGDYGLINDAKFNDYLREAVEVLNSQEILSHADTYWKGVDEIQERLRQVLTDPNAGWGDDKGKGPTIKDEEPRLKRDVNNLAKLRAGMIDNLAAGRLGMGEEPEQAAEHAGAEGAGFSGRVRWKRNDVAAEIAENNLRGIYPQNQIPQNVLAREVDRIKTTQPDVIERIHKERVDSILTTAQRQGTVSAHKELIDVINKTAWIDDPATLSAIKNGDAVRLLPSAHGIDFDSLLS